MSPYRPKFAGRLPLAAFLLLAVCAALPLASVRAEDAVPPGTGESVGSVSLPPGYSPADVKAALTSAFLGRDWTVKSASDTAVVGYLKHRGVEAYLTAQYSAAAVNFYSLAWKIDGAGDREKPDVPKAWIANIKKDLVKDLMKAGAHP